MAKNKKTKFSFSFFLLLLVFILGASFFIAQNTWAADGELEVRYPQLPGTGIEAPTSVRTLLPNYILYIFYFSLAISGFIAFGSLVYGGFHYLTSAGSATRMAEGRKQIFAAILGLVILFSSYLILTTVNPQLKIFSLTREPIQDITPPSVDQLTRNQFTNAWEIPVGAYITNALKGRRLEIILAKAEIIKKASDEVKKLSEELKNKTADCACEKTSPNCGGQDCGEAFCSGDPCPPRQEIIEKIKPKLQASVAALNKAIEDSELQKNVNSLKKDWVKLEVFGDIIMKGCPAPPINLNEMASLQTLDKDIKIQKPLGMETTNDPANFYCFLAEDQLAVLSEFDKQIEKGYIPPTLNPPPSAAFTVGGIPSAGAPATPVSMQPGGVSIDNIPYFSQKDSRWADSFIDQCSDTLGPAGCGIVSATMMLNYFNVNIDPPTLAAQVRGSQEYFCGIGSSLPNLAEMVKNTHGISYNSYWDCNDFVAMKNELAQGRPIIVSYNRYRGQWSHITVVRGMDDNNIYFEDPNWGFDVFSKDTVRDNFSCNYFAAFYK